MFSFFRKNLNTHNLPATLKWVENYNLKYSYKKLKRSWTPLFNPPDQSNSIKLYTQSTTSKDQLLILPCLFQQIDLHALVSQLNSLGISCNILIPSNLFLTESELHKAQSLIGPVCSFAVGLSYNLLQADLSTCLVFNSVVSPHNYYSSLSCAEDKELILSIRSNYLYLHKKNLELKHAFVSDIKELIPVNTPDLKASPKAVFYETSEPLHTYPSVSEKPSVLTACREPLLAQIMKILINSHN